MASFIGTLFPTGKQERTERPGTPNRNSFVNPASTPQGSPSKKTVPPGANELPNALEGMKLIPPVLDPSIKLGRPQSVVTPLSPGRNNVQATDESVFVDDSVLHKSTAAPGAHMMKHGQENTPPPLSSARAGGGLNIAHSNTDQQAAPSHSHAAVSRHEHYLRDRPTTPATRRFNTNRGLTPEELEILKKPSIKRLVNVTQLCEWILASEFVATHGIFPLTPLLLLCRLYRFPGLLFRSSHLHRRSPEQTGRFQGGVPAPTRDR